MNIALLLQHKLIQGLQWLMGYAPTGYRQANFLAQPMTPRYTHTTRPHATGVDVLRQRPGLKAAARPSVRQMPLRVLRVVEKDQPRSCTGRLVISGRMADVCAELDRLVAREGSLH